MEKQKDTQSQLTYIAEEYWAITHYFKPVFSIGWSGYNHYTWSRPSASLQAKRRGESSNDKNN